MAAGWAIDLFAGRESRAHDDLEIVVARASFGAVRAALPELTWFGAGALADEPGRVWPVDDAPAELKLCFRRKGNTFAATNASSKLEALISSICGSGTELTGLSWRLLGGPTEW